MSLAVASRHSAAAAGLAYAGDDQPGIRRRRQGKAFSYRGPDGAPVRDADTLARIRALVIPPAWTDVWICPDAHGHVQATGRDARGRKQYRYHPRWREVRDATKYERLIAFAEALPRIRHRVVHDLRRPGLPREKLLAALVRLLERTLIRVGNEEYARENRSFGLTTLRRRHAKVTGERLHFRFRGKSGKSHEIGLRDRRLSGIVKRCQDLPGQELFRYLDPRSGRPRSVDSADVNAYLRAAAGEEFTAKDFRTWAGTVRAAWALSGTERPRSDAATKRSVTRVVKEVARRLGNTVAISRRCYIHPVVVHRWVAGDLPAFQTAPSPPAGGLSGVEASVLGFLRDCRKPADA